VILLSCNEKFRNRSWSVCSQMVKKVSKILVGTAVIAVTTIIYTTLCCPVKKYRKHGIAFKFTFNAVVKISKLHPQLQSVYLLASLRQKADLKVYSDRLGWLDLSFGFLRVP
jgi:hypothetical protein